MKDDHIVIEIKTDEYPNDGRTLLLCRNTNAASRTVTATPTGDLGPLVNETGVAVTVPAIAAAEPGFAVLGLLDIDKFNALDGNVDIAASASPGLSYAVLRLPRRP